MKLISWNVNGLRSVLGKGFEDFVTQYQPDILCLQETKAMPEQVLGLPIGDGLFWKEYKTFWNSAQRKGYSGTVIATKILPLSVTMGIGLSEIDKEGRVITAEFEEYFVVCVYTPNSKPDLSRLIERTQVWDRAFLRHLLQLQKRKPVIFCGDLNVAHKEIDLARPASNHYSAGFTDEERANFDAYVAAGFVDTFRYFYPTRTDSYSWWSYLGGARARNVGWRIDYVCVSSSLLPRVLEAFILHDVMGSDHCPVGVVLD